MKEIGYAGVKEPFDGLFTQGMVCHETYKDTDGKWLSPDEIEKNADGSHKALRDGSSVETGRVSFHFCFGRNARDDANELESERHHESDASEDVYFVTSEERCSEL